MNLIAQINAYLKTLYGLPTVETVMAEASKFVQCQPRPRCVAVWSESLREWVVIHGQLPSSDCIPSGGPNCNFFATYPMRSLKRSMKA